MRRHGCCGSDLNRLTVDEPDHDASYLGGIPVDHPVAGRAVGAFEQCHGVLHPSIRPSRRTALLSFTKYRTDGRIGTSLERAYRTRDSRARLLGALDVDREDRRRAQEALADGRPLAAADGPLDRCDPLARRSHGLVATLDAGDDDVVVTVDPDYDPSQLAASERMTD